MTPSLNQILTLYRARVINDAMRKIVFDAFAKTAVGVRTEGPVRKLLVGKSMLQVGAGHVVSGQ